MNMRHTHGIRPLHNGIRLQRILCLCIPRMMSAALPTLNGYQDTGIFPELCLSDRMSGYSVPNRGLHGLPSEACAPYRRTVRHPADSSTGTGLRLHWHRSMAMRSSPNRKLSIARMSQTADLVSMGQAPSFPIRLPCSTHDAGRQPIPDCDVPYHSMPNNSGHVSHSLSFLPSASRICMTASLLWFPGFPAMENCHLRLCIPPSARLLLS